MTRTLPLLAATLVFTSIACADKPASDHVPCDAPGGCSSVLSTLATGETVVDLIPDGEGGAYAALLGSGEYPACTQGVVCHGQLWRIDAEGNVAWKIGERVAVDRPVRIPYGVAYRMADGRLAAIDRDGVRRWKTDPIDAGMSVAVIGDAVFVTGGGQMIAIDETTGETRWSAPFAVTLPMRPLRLDTPSSVLAGGYDGAELLYASFDRNTGAPQWESRLPAQYSAPGAVPGERLGVAMLVSDRLSLRRFGGRELWSYDGEEGFRNVVAALDGGWFAAGPAVEMITRFRENGTVLWSGPAPGGPVVWLARAPDGQLLLGQQDGLVRKMKEDTGITLWQYGGVASVKAFSRPTFTSKGNTILFGANVGEDSDTNLSTLTPTGQGLERWDAGARIHSIALGDDDRLFVATVDGRVYLRLGASL